MFSGTQYSHFHDRKTRNNHVTSFYHTTLVIFNKILVFDSEICFVVKQKLKVFEEERSDDDHAHQQSAWDICSTVKNMIISENCSKPEWPRELMRD